LKVTTPAEEAMLTTIKSARVRVGVSSRKECDLKDTRSRLIETIGGKSLDIGLMAR
jgi:hypothetical protein